MKKINSMEASMALKTLTLRPAATHKALSGGSETYSEAPTLHCGNATGQVPGANECLTGGQARSSDTPEPIDDSDLCTALIGSINLPLEDVLYDPLRPGNTRIVAITSGDNGDEIELALSQTSVSVNNDGNPKQPYTALSYTWGSEAEREMVPLKVRSHSGGYHVIQVTRSLLVALKRRPCPEQPCHLWVDQISIDQSSLTEKALQIPRMRDIYKSAASVWIWLGDTADYSDLAMDKLAYIWSQLVQISDRTGCSPSPGMVMDHLPLLVGSKDSINIRVWQAMANLIKRAWFSRLWVLHEATALSGEETWVGCGSKMVPIQAVLWMYDVYDLSRPHVDEFDLLSGFTATDSYNLGPLLTFDRMRLTGIRWQLLILLNLTRLKHVMDPRDKIYCMLPYASDYNGTKPEIVVDYLKSCEQVYTDFAVWYIQKYRELDFLGYCYVFKMSNYEIPYWVPDWTMVPRTSPFRTTERMDDPTSEPLYNASRSRLQTLEFPERLPSGPEILRVSGIKLATIAKIGKRALSNDFDWKVENSWRPVNASYVCTLNDMPFSEVFERTLCADLRFTEPELNRLSRGGRIALRPGTRSKEMTQFKTVTVGRRLFYTTAPGDEVRGLMGIGRDVKPGDEIWILKGGKMVYALKPCVRRRNRSHVCLDLTGGPSGEQLFEVGSTQYKFVAECFMLGLMNGEAIDMLGEIPKRLRPPTLEDMDTEFRPIHLL